MHWTYCDTAAFSARELQKAYEELSSSRKEYIDRLRQQKDKLRSLTGELLVRQLLKAHYGMEKVQLHRSENGQPYLTDRGLYVSITHCEEKIACAVSEAPVGIDLEKLRPIDLRLCRHVCVPEEKAYVLGDYPGDPNGMCQDRRVLERFFEIWTAKEAYFKKRGTGITDLKSVNILPLPRQMHRLDDYILQIL